MHTLQTHVCHGRAPEAAVGYLATKGQLVGIYMTLGGYNGSTNGCRWVSEVLPTGVSVAKTRQVRYVGETAEDSQNRLLCI
eukprot:COSAG02_NODE_14971_length_1218_cov_6.458445_1_plen_81_part_00